MKKYELILFDFDGTLVDTIGDITYYANQTLARYGYSAQTQKNVQSAVGWGVHELLKKLAPAFEADTACFEEAVNFFKMSYQAMPVRLTRPYKLVKETLCGPLRNIKKAVLTNKPQDIAIKILRELELYSCFEIVIGIHAGFAPKPDPSGVHHILNILSTDRGKALLIGDSQVDSETSKNAGIDFGWVDYGYHLLHRETPLMRFSSPVEWARIVS